MDFMENRTIVFENVFFRDLENIEEVEEKNDIRLPVEFTTKEKWIRDTKKVKIPCWYCNYINEDSIANNFTPYFIPKWVEKNKDGTRMAVEGWFHTPNCARNYIEDTSRTLHEKYEKYQLLQRLHCILQGNNRIFHIMEAPSRHQLKHFGKGSLSYDDFTDICRNCQRMEEKA